MHADRLPGDCHEPLIRNLTQEVQAMDRPACWDEDVERLAKEVWLPVAEDFSERSGDPGGELALPLVGTSFFGLRNLSNQSVSDARSRLRRPSVNS
ncbi:hypothetical protein PRNP1_013781 [Phytophthora ramorum]